MYGYKVQSRDQRRVRRLVIGPGVGVESKRLSRISAGASVIQVTANDADDATYGNSAKVVYSILEGQPYFSVDPETGE